MKKALSWIVCLCLLLGCIAAAGAEPASAGDGLMSYEQVLRLIKWISDGYYKNKTYEEVAAFAGVEGLDKGHRDTSMSALGDHYFDWIADSDPTHYIHVCFRGRDDSGRFEACQWNTSGFRSEEWANVDLTDWLAATACHETAETALQVQRFSNPLVTVTVQMPVAGWRTRVSSNSAYFYNERGENTNDPRIEVVVYENPGMFDFYLEQYENVQPAASRVIAGVEMAGRTYHYSGWDWTEYSAQLSATVSVGVRISRVGMGAGTEGSALLDSLCLTWTEADGTACAFSGAAPAPAPAAEPAPAADPVIPAAETPAAEAPLTAGPADYAGVWYSTWMHTGGMDGDPRSMYGMMMTLTLNADGTGEFDYFGSDGGGYWAADEEGIVRYWGDGTALSLLSDGSLCWGSYLGGYILFSHDQAAVAAVFPEAPAAQPVEVPVQPAAPEIPAAPAGNADGNYIGVKYVGKTYMAGGVTMDASVLGGEYAITLNADGTAAFTMAGMEVPGYHWQQVGGHLEVDAYGTVLMALTPEDDGSMIMNYSGAFTLIMLPQ